MKKRPIVLAAVSDTHCGSTIGLCPDPGPRLDDGGVYQPSPGQRWLWTRWLDYWSFVASVVRRERADLHVLLNGDLRDGVHHDSSQLVSTNEEVQAYVATEAFNVMRALKPSCINVVRGTEAHTGPSGSAETALARWLNAERDPETDSWSSWHLRKRYHGWLVDAQHHGRVGGRPWTKVGAVASQAVEIAAELVDAGLESQIPDIAIRSHRHVFVDSGMGNHRTRVIQLPAWQLKSGFVHKVSPASLSDIGGVVFVFRDAKEVPEVLVKRWRYDPPAIRVA
jgi:hypothetical protein